MSAVAEGADGWTRAMRWTARLFSLVTAALLFLFLADSATRVIPRLSWTNPQGMPLIAALLMAVTGVLLIWSRELAGGLMALVGALSIVALVALGAGTDMIMTAALFALPVLMVGLLALGCCVRNRTARRPAGE